MTASLASFAFSVSFSSHCSLNVLQNLAIGAGAVGSLQLTYISKVMSGWGRGKMNAPCRPLILQLSRERRWLTLAAPEARSWSCPSLCRPPWDGSLSGSVGRGAASPQRGRFAFAHGLAWDRL